MRTDLNVSGEASDSQVQLARIVYYVQMAGLILGLPFLIALIFNYLRRDQVLGTWVETHFHWQIMTFWYGLGILLVGLMTIGITFGSFLIVFDAFWVSYRIFYGWSQLNKGRAIFKMP